MNINELDTFAAPVLGDMINGEYPIPDPGGSQGGAIWQSIGPGLKVYVFPDGTQVFTDEAGNIIEK